MPAIKRMNQGDSGNAASALQFNTLPPGGGYVSLYAAGVTVLDNIGLTVGSKPVTDLADVNIEISADVVDVSRDMVVFREPVPAGEIFLPVNVTTALGWHLMIEWATG